MARMLRGFVCLALLCLLAFEVAGKELNYLRHMCLNPVIVEEEYVFNSTSSKRRTDLELVHITQFQRHLDRWMYEHDLIDNLCWTSQLNSTDPRMLPQCTYNLSSVWAQWPRQADPYSTPDKGRCTCPQLTRQGQVHARQLGILLRDHLKQVGSKWIVEGLQKCPAGLIRLEFSNEQKNQMTAQYVYSGLCDRLPSPDEFPYSQCVVPASPAPNTPFFLNVGVCNTYALHEMSDEAALEMLDAPFILDEAVPLANWFRLVTGHSSMSSPATRKSAPTWLDNLLDCSVVHQCHRLKDLPPQFRADQGDLLGTADLLETRSRVFPFDFFAPNRPSWLLYTSLYYGYYFCVLLDRMSAVIGNTPGAIPIAIQVMSDSNISPLLKALQLNDAALIRPVWGSTLVFELYHNGSNEYFVRVIYNGKIQMLPGVCQSSEYCHFDKFVSTIEPLMPTPETCPTFFANYPQALR